MEVQLGSLDRPLPLSTITFVLRVVLQEEDPQERTHTKELVAIRGDRHLPTPAVGEHLWLPRTIVQAACLSRRPGQSDAAYERRVHEKLATLPTSTDDLGPKSTAWASAP